MKLALIAYGCLTAGALIGFFTCALLTAAKTADHHTELAQAYARGWTLGYHAGKNAREE